MSATDPHPSGSAAHDPRAGDAPAVPEPDDKDWTWVLERTCPECGFDAAALPRAELLATAGALARTWAGLLREGGAELRVRPAPAVWSPAEYGCHVRDVYARTTARVAAMLSGDDPVFENWDQDATAIADRYWEQDPAVVAGALLARAADLDATARPGGADLDDAGWRRPGQRSNGSRFTVESLLRYTLHDVAHHLHDVGA
ncbi:MAG: DinB family protein [Kineosporiaceae bacterium]